MRRVHSRIGERGGGFGAANNQSSSDAKPVDISFAALDLLGQMALTVNQNENVV